MTNIAEIRGRQVLDSRGNPTVEAEVLLASGTNARAIVPPVREGPDSVSVLPVRSSRRMAACARPPASESGKSSTIRSYQVRAFSDLPPNSWLD